MKKETLQFIKQLNQDELNPFCGCGDPAGRFKLMKRLIQLSWGDNPYELQNLFQSETELIYQMLYSVFDALQLIEHGISQNFHYLKTRGEQLLKITDAELKEWEELPDHERNSIIEKESQSQPEKMNLAIINLENVSKEDLEKLRNRLNKIKL